MILSFVNSEKVKKILQEILLFNCRKINILILLSDKSNFIVDFIGIGNFSNTVYVFLQFILQNSLWFNPFVNHWSFFPIVSWKSQKFLVAESEKKKETRRKYIKLSRNPSKA